LGISPLRHLQIVVFPHPLGPVRTTNSPGETPIERSSIDGLEAPVYVKLR
jgi:hypothetical protein